MKRIGECPGELSLDICDVRPSQITIEGVSVDVCGACGELVFGSRRFERRMVEARRTRRARRAMKVDLRSVDWMESDSDLDS